MKLVLKTIFAAVVCYSALSFGQSFTIDQQRHLPDASTATNNQLQLSVAAPINDTWVFQTAMQNNVNNQTRASTARYAMGAQKNWGQIWGPFDGYSRFVVGRKIVSAADPVSYYELESGIIYNTPITGLTVRGGYNYRNAFTVSDRDRTDSYRWNAGYKLTKNDTVGVRYTRQNQVAAGDVTAVYYTRNF
jgi:hypothetical protein